MIKLGVSAWLTNLVTGALLKQASIILLSIFAVLVLLGPIHKINFSASMSPAQGQAG